MKMRNCLHILFSLTVGAASSTDVAATLELPPEEVARQFIADSLAPTAEDHTWQIHVTAADSRMNLPVCRSKTEAFWPSHGRRRGHTVIGVRCADEGGWQIYLAAKITQWRQIVVTTRPLVRGHKITGMDVALKNQPVDQMRGVHFDHITGIIGATVKQSIQADIALTNQYVCTICRGETITIRTDSKEFAISTKAEALTQGNVGDRIQVRNLSSGRHLSAQVVGPLLAEVAL